MTEHPREVVHAFVQAVNTADSAALAEVLDPAFVDRTPATGQSPGREGFIEEKLEALRSAFPDLRLIVADEVAEADKIAWRWTLEGTNDGEFAGHPPTGASVAFQGMNIERLAGGKIVEHWSIHDARDLLEQLGLFAPLR